MSGRKKSRGVLDRFKDGLRRKKKVRMSSADVVLASYPKSGNTWARFFWANLLFPDKQPIHFNNVIDCVPEIRGDERIVITPPPTGAAPKVYKSHSLYNPDFPKVIYLLRDARDVYVSYFFYLQKRVPEISSFAAFLENDGLYPHHWSEHCDSWLREERDNVLVVRYEDLKQDPLVHFGRMVEFAGIYASAKEIETAVQASEFNKMASVEKKHGRPFKNKEEAKIANPFMRKGVVGDWINYFGEEERRIFKAINNDMLVKLKYVDDDRW